MPDLEAVLRRGRALGVDAAAAAATRDLATAADRAGLVDVAVASIDSAIGPLFLAVSDRGLVRIAFGGNGDALVELARRVSPRVMEVPTRLDPVRRQLDEYLDGRRRNFDLRVDLSLVSGFGRRALQAARRIPCGSVATYGDLARRAGSPRAARAVGHAMATNPIPLVVPCHRVVPAGGGIGNYGGGVEMKAWLLDLESRDPAR